jgi:hypothetical protein
MTPCLFPLSHPVARPSDHAPYSGFSQRRSVPEDEVKTVLLAEVHAQIFAIASLQGPPAVIHGHSLCNDGLSSERPQCFVWLGSQCTSRRKAPNNFRKIARAA